MPDTTLRCPFCSAAIKKPPAASAALRCGSCLRLFPVEASQSSQAGSLSGANNPTSAIRAHARTLDLTDTAQQVPAEMQHKLSAFSRPTVALPAPPAKRWRQAFKAVGLVSAALLLCLTLAAQILWAQRDRYQHQPKLYPIFTAACELLECSVPAFADIAALRGEELSVEAGETNSLIVSFRLLNEAPLPQAPPVLILSFTTPSQRSVALREFAPADYLPASRDPQRALNSGEGVDISLALVDPGPDAVNYTLAFRAP